MHLGRSVADRADQAHGDGDEDSDGGRILQRADVRRDHPDQKHKRQQQVDVAHEIPEAWQLRTRDALEAELLGLEMHGDEDAAEIQHGRQDGPEGDLTVGDIHIFGHEERGRAHDGRHDLTAGRGSRLDRAGEFGPVAGTFHHRDRDRARGNGVADGRAGHHAAQCGRDDRDLGRAAGGPAGDGIGEINEEARDAGTLQKRAKDDKHGDELRAHLYGRAQHAGRAEKERVDHAAEHLIKRLAALEHTHERVHEQRTDDHKDRHTDTAAAELGKRQDAGHADGDEKRRHLGGAGERLDKRTVVKAVVEKRSRANDHDDNVIPRQAVGMHMLLAGGVGQITHDDDQTKECRQAHLKRGGAEQGRPDAIDRKQRHDDGNDDLGFARPDAGGRLAIILAHDGVHILLQRGGFRSGCGLFGVRHIRGNLRSG